jgi:hypothetical protein
VTHQLAIKEPNHRRSSAIFTDAVKVTHVIRKVLLRQIVILNYVNPF